AQALALRGAFHQAGDVDEGELGWDDLGRAGDGRELFQARVRHRDLADVGLDRTERIVRGLRRLCFGQRVEQCRFADIRQADDPAAESHELRPRVWKWGRLSRWVANIQLAKGVFV